MSESQGGNAIRIRDVRKVYGFRENPLVALDTVSVAIRENEFFTLLGPSGCGKTTLLRLIAGFDYPTSGQIFLYDDDIAPLPPFRRPVNTVFQSYALFPHMTVAENIGFGLRTLGRPKEEIAARVSEMLRLVRMVHLGDRHVNRISGGQQQRVALARALAPRPKVLLLDEPLSALDYKLRKDMQFELKRLKDETGITFIFVTHDQEEALTMSDRIAVMSAGKILQVGTPRDIYDRPADRFVAGFIGESNFLISEIRHLADGRATVELGSGAKVSVAVPADCFPDDRLTIVVRPEHARLVPADETAMLRGVVESTVYLGTDTHFRIKLEDDTVFTVRQQNGGNVDLPSLGERTGILFDVRSAQALRD